MQDSHHRAQAGGVVSRCGRMSDEVIMIGKNSPCFQVPAELFRYCQQAAMQDAQACRAAKMMDLLISGAGNEIGAALGSWWVGAWGHGVLGSAMGVGWARAGLEGKPKIMMPAYERRRAAALQTLRGHD